MNYSSQAITTYKKTIAHNAIKMFLEQKAVGWSGDATSGFTQGTMFRYPSLTGPTLPPVNGPTGTVQFFVGGPAVNAHNLYENEPGATVSSDSFPPGTTLVREEEVQGLPGWVLQCDPWTSLYSPWLERIDSALQGWEEIPEHSAFATATDKAVAALEELTPTNGFGASTPEEFRAQFADPDRTNAFDLLSEYVGGTVESDMVFAFRDKYGPIRVKTVLQNQGQIALGLTLILGGEKELWLKAGEDIMALCEAAENAFHYEPPDFDFNIDLKVVKAFLDLAGVFVPPNIKPFVVGASAVAGFLQAVIPEDKAEETPPPPLSASTAEQVATNLEEAILTLRRATFAQEGELHRCASQLKDDIGTVESHYLHIHPAAGLDSGVTTSEVLADVLSRVAAPKPAAQ